MIPICNRLTDELVNADMVFIADLHLSDDYSELLAAFYQLLAAVQQTKPAALYILGDWFDAWLGDDWLDDSEAAWLRELVTELTAVTAAGVSIYFCHGNRDFALGQAFLDSFGGTLLPEVSTLTHASKHYRLEHGDLLCTDDKAYQRFRKVMRNPLLLRLLKMQSLKRRKALAAKLRQKSQQSNQQLSQKKAYIMDVNAHAVLSAAGSVQALIHGHTHRPAEHDLGCGKKRYVLGDWRVMPHHAHSHQAQVEAVIGILKGEQFKLVNMVFDVAVER